MATVYLGDDLKHEGKVALKVLKRDSVDRRLAPEIAIGVERHDRRAVRAATLEPARVALYAQPEVQAANPSRSGAISPSGPSKDMT